MRHPNPDPSTFVVRDKRSLLLALSLLWGCGDPLSALDEAAMQGRVDGREVTYYRRGSAGPSVVFESGLGDGYAPWRDVLEKLPQTTAVFAYDRAGYGASTPSTTPRDGTHLVEELRRNLEELAVPPPYLLVGHSLGGQLMLLLARLHPELVAGLVLVDARPADFTRVCSERLGGDLCLPTASVVTTFPPAARAEYEAASMTEHELVNAPALPDLPVIVLSRTAEEGAFEAVWSERQTALANELHTSPRVISGAGHYVQRDEPAAVVEAIRELLGS